MCHLMPQWHLPKWREEEEEDDDEEDDSTVCTLVEGAGYSEDNSL